MESVKNLGLIFWNKVSSYVVGESIYVDNKRHNMKIPRYSNHICNVCCTLYSPPLEILSCGDFFHRRCILDHFQFSSDCPACGFSQTSQEIDELVKEVIIV